MIATLTLNPSVDQHLIIEKLVKDDAIRARSVEWYAGGKGINVTRVVHELGGQGCAFGFVGGLSGQMLTRCLDTAGIAHRFIRIDGSTRINTTITDLSDRTQTHVRTAGPSVTASEMTRLTQQILTLTSHPGFWVLGGSLPPGAPTDLYEQLINQLEATGARCVLDTDDEALVEGLEATPFLIKPNEYEFERLTGQAADTDQHIVKAARRIVDRGTQVVMVTLGPRGAVVITAEDQFRVNTPAVEVKSKVGAGDSTVAGCLVALERGATLRDAVRYGIAAGTAAVLTEGTRMCERREVERLLPQIEIQTIG